MAFSDHLQVAPIRWDAMYSPSHYWDYLRTNAEPAILSSPDGHRWALAVDAVERAEARGSATHIAITKAVALIEQHRQQGDYLLIITATNRFITAPIAAALKVDELIATEPEVIDGIYTGEIIDPPCYQEGKVARWQAWLAQQGRENETCYFYSDSINDLPLLSAVQQPIVVDPCEQLRLMANAKDWPIISLR